MMNEFGEIKHSARFSRYSRKLLTCFAAAVMALSSLSVNAFADEVKNADKAVTALTSAELRVEDGYVYLGRLKIAKKKGKNSYTMIKQSDAHSNGQALEALLSISGKKTLTLPKGTLKTDRTLIMRSNTTISAVGTTVYQTDPDKNLVMHNPTKTNKKSIVNVKIKGGTWKIKDNEKQKKSTSTFRFNFASNITLDGCKVLTNYKSHAVELIACNNVKLNKCSLIAKGKTIKGSLEEALQIDISTKATAPTVAKFGKKFVAGQTCENITVSGCTISGSRGICANKTDTQNKKYLGKYHKNIKIIGCTITGATSEAVAMHNAVGLTIKNNKITSKNKSLSTVYGIGLNIATFKKNSISSKYKNVISGNTIKGARQGLYMISYGGNKFGTTTIKKNKIYCRNGKSNALKVSDCKKLVKSGNKLYKW